MEKLIDNVTYPGDWLPESRRVEITRPLSWLGAGAKDVLRAPWVSSVYGLIFALLGYGLLQVSNAYTHYSMTYLAGFFLLGSFLAVGLYAVARRLEHDKPANLYHAMTSWHRSGLSIALFGAVVAIGLTFWIRFSWVLIGLLFTNGGDVSVLVTPGLGTFQGLEIVALYALSGSLLAGVVFALSMISLPMMYDRRVNFVTAMRTSLATVQANKLAISVWAALVVVIVGLGIVTSKIGLIIAFPLLGYAAWHAYRDLVPRDAQ